MAPNSRGGSTCCNGARAAGGGGLSTCSVWRQQGGGVERTTCGVGQQQQGRWQPSVVECKRAAPPVQQPSTAASSTPMILTSHGIHCPPPPPSCKKGTLAPHRAVQDAPHQGHARASACPTRAASNNSGNEQYSTRTARRRMLSTEATSRPDSRNTSRARWCRCRGGGNTRQRRRA